MNIIYIKITIPLFSFIKENKGIVIIFILGFVLRILAINADDFLHPWDERFHALVAANMMDNPFIPILRRNPITNNFDPNAWCCNTIWLHKQPLFMWQMAISMKLFGISEWSMRLPSAIMGSILILVVYRIAIILSQNKAVALLAALMISFSNFHLQMISGVHGMDHNDVAHGFYVLLSIWAFCEHHRKPKWYWIVLIGLFSGAAVLNKWLTGLFVYLVWLITLVFSFLKKNINQKVLFYCFCLF